MTSGFRQLIQSQILIVAMKIFVALILVHLNFSLAIEPILIVHGGAGSVSNERIPGKYRGTKLSARIGYKVLIETGNVLDAVEAAIRSMEVDENFNAGYGSALTRDGTIEMDACIMDGKSMKVGAVTGVQNIYHPITLARSVMDNTIYNFLGSSGAMDLATSEGFQFLKPGMLVSENAKRSLENWKRRQENSTMKEEGNTVGAVAIDVNGNIAAATSTGGLTGKLTGRIGDSPIVGIGTYANEIAGLSATGEGEVIMKAVLNHDIVKRMEYLRQDIKTASQEACDEMLAKYNGDGGVIGLDRDGNVAVAFSSDQMSWAYQKGNSVFYGINRDEIFSEDA